LKIIENYDPEGTLLKDIPAGELFVYDGSYYMKIAEDKQLNDTIAEHINLAALAPALDMATGVLVLIKKEERVPPIYSRIRINGRAD
jgi:hypothetical protein